jgi:hypothetical protein
MFFFAVLYQTLSKEKSLKPLKFQGFFEISALRELGSAAGGFQAVLLDLQNLQSIALQWIADFENQFPFKMSPVNFCHIV